MISHELILLSPYRMPAQHSMVLADEDMVAWLNGHQALWHPGALWNAQSPPRVEAQYDHEQPRTGVVYALPESPPLYLPDDWHDRVKQAGSVAFTSTGDRAATFANLQAALSDEFGWSGAFALDADTVGAFLGVGMGYALQAALAEAMEHDNLLESASFWEDVQAAIAGIAGFDLPTKTPTQATPHIPDSPHLERSTDYDEFAQTPDAPIQPADFEEFTPTEPANRDEPPASPPPEPRSPLECLRSAAGRLTQAREVLYPVTIHLLDLWLLSEKSSAPFGLTQGNPINVLSCGSLIEGLKDRDPELLGQLRERIASGQVEILGGHYLEREDPLLPLESQLWNLRKGLETTRELLGAEIRVFARKRFGYQPQMPLILTTHGITRAIFLCFDETSGLPSYNSTTISWPSPDGKQLDAFVRVPLKTDSPQTFFNLGHSWFKTTREDHNATLCFIHGDQPARPEYEDLLHLARLSNTLGQWRTFTQYFTEVYAGEHVSSLGPDEFHFDYLAERTEAHFDDPVSGFARHTKLRRRVDSCWTLAALERSLARGNPGLDIDAELSQLEDRLEIGFRTPKATPTAFFSDDAKNLDRLEKQIVTALADRLQSRSAPDQPGYLVLNPCAFARRLALELPGSKRAVPIEGPVKACQVDGDLLRVVVEVPALGFAWIPREGPPGYVAPAARLKLADQGSMTLRNEFFEVALDPQTGGLRSIADHKNHLNRLAGRLLFGPGSWMAVDKIQVTSSGPALGEIVAEGKLLGEQKQELAKFKQRYRVWLGRPVLEIQTTLEPLQPPAGYPWHAYFGARFAWRDERIALLRSSFGAGFLTTHTRPQTPDYLEFRMGRLGTALYPLGLPFHQRQEGRMLDVILAPAGEKETVFDLAIALDREQPMQMALGLATPPIVMPTSKGAPHVGTSGWLFHLDTPNLMMTRMVPGGRERKADGSAPPRDAVTARLLECGDQSGQAELRCVRDPKRAAVLDAQGHYLIEAGLSGDAVLLEVSPNDMIQVQIEF